jgi:Poly(ADP-ribose) polymerase catalytic domain
MENFIIDTEAKLKDKQELIQKLVGINAANDAIKSKTGAVISGSKPNPVDLNYQRLNSNMSTIKKDSDEFKMIKKYIANGGGSDMEMVDCFDITRDGEAGSFNPKKFGNK